MTEAYRTPADAERAFYRAFERADIATMTGVWDDAPDVVCIHPLGPLLAGPEAVLGSWRALLGGGGGLRFTIRVNQAFENGNLAIRVVSEIIHVIGEADARAPVLATNAYRRTGNGWRMILHHGSPQPRPMPVADPPAPERSSRLH